MFVAGSFIRGEATAYSDLDRVVVYEALPNAHRESFRFEGFPVEVFVHDSETLNYFFHEVDRPTAVPSLAQMVREGIEVPASTALSRSLKALAIAVIENGPPRLTEEDDRNRRYIITDLLDDMRDPRSYAELIETGAQLCPAIADYYLRTKGLWSAKGKSIPRALERVSPEFNKRYCEASESLFRKGNPAAVIAMAEELLKSNGGLMFEGYRRDAPAAWRK